MNVLLLTGAPRSSRIRDFLKTVADRVTETDRPLTVEGLRREGVDLMVIHGYAPIIRPDVVAAYRHRIVNLHNTFLPWGRGLMGNVWSFFEDTPKGVSLHFIDEGIDTGDVIVREPVDIGQDETLQSSWDILMDRLERLFLERWEEISTGTCRTVPQRDLGETGSYHDRQLSDRLLPLFPARWATPVGEVAALGREYRQDPAAFERTYGVILQSKDER